MNAAVETKAAVAEPAVKARKRFAFAPFTVRGKLSPRTDTLFGLAGVGSVIALWLILSYGKLVRPDFLPTPNLLLEGFSQLYNAYGILPLWRSFMRVTEALLLVILIGVPVGVLIGAFPPADAFTRKIISGGKAVPVTAVGGLITLWFGLAEEGKIVYLFLGAIFYMTILVKNAIVCVSEDYVRVALDLGANRKQVIWRVLLPGALPQIWDAVAVCNGIMWTYIILAEYISPDIKTLGVGYLIFNANRVGGSGNGAGKVFALIIIVALVSSLTDYLLNLIRKRFFNW